jgi:UDP-N-acetyl-D-mannosaminuronic acid dehydrogenase
VTESFKRVCVIGLGYIGLPTSAVVAGRGIDVIGVDVDPRVVETINRGEIHIVEPELDIVVRAAVLSGRLRAAPKPEPADVFLIAVPTPFKNDHQPDLDYIESATRSIAPVLRPGNLLILESTSPVGTTEQMMRWLAALRPDLRLPEADVAGCDINIAYCPERVLPGQVLRELVNNDRVVGGMTPACAQRAAEFYRLFVNGECVTTNARTAEMAKLTENAFRDVNIAFANELSLICERQDINVWELIRLANRHPRVNILQPGPGVGGHCIAVDPWFIVHSAPDVSLLIRTAREVNDRKPQWVLGKIRAAVKAVQGRATVACLGLAFKPDIDDLRESPALKITEMLAQESTCRVLAVEPFVKRLPTFFSDWPDVELMEAEQAIAAADVVVLLVNHAAFKEIDRRNLEGKVVIDTRGLWG